MLKNGSSPNLNGAIYTIKSCHNKYVVKLDLSDKLFQTHIKHHHKEAIVD
jgi:hypothetical protein